MAVIEPEPEEKDPLSGLTPEELENARQVFGSFDSTAVRRGIRDLRAKLDAANAAESARRR